MMRIISILLFFICALSALAQQPAKIDVTVADQNGAVLPGAIVTLVQDEHSVATAETDFSGKVTFSTPAGTFLLQAEKKGFYTAKSDPLALASGETRTIQVSLQQYREFSEQVEVLSQTSPIDVQNTSSSNQLTNDEIINIPFADTRDFRNVLPFIPRVIQDTSGQPHIAGASTQQSEDYLDGFEISQPAGGTLQMRVNPDALGRIDVESSRYSVQYGKGSGGLLALETQSPDNRFRFSFVDFVPTFQFVKGLHFNNWTPRGSLSGPIIKDKVWFYISHESETDLNIVKELPASADSSQFWRTDDLLKLQLNQGSRNTFTVFALLNYLDSEHAGLSALVPAPSTTTRNNHNYILGIRDSFLPAQDALLDLGFGVHHFHQTVTPYGNLPFFQTPTTELGSFFQFQDGSSSRIQGFANLFLPPLHWAGKHEFQIGAAADELHDSLLSLRNLVTDVEDSPAGCAAINVQTCLVTRTTRFNNVPKFDQTLTEESAYLLDRWSAAERFMLEAGARVDHDSFIGDALISPRIAGSYMIAKSSETKISAGVGVYYDRSSLDLLTRPAQGSRTDTFYSYDASGMLASTLTIPTFFAVNRPSLRGSGFLNWSISLERRLPGNVYARLEYQNRLGNHGFAYEPDPVQTGLYDLANHRRDRYRAISAMMRKDLKPGYPIYLAYTRSAAHSNEVLDFSVDNLVFGPQIAGPLPWDAPNQLVAWGLLPFHLPLLKQTDFAYSLVWRSGFPFVLVNQQQQLAPSAGFQRFPDFLVFDSALEHKFTFRHYQFAVRGGIDNITNSSNPAVVNNILGSPQFLSFSGTSHRTLNARIRLLGKK